jgi:hypothetical protein
MGINLVVEGTAHEIKIRPWGSDDVIATIPRAEAISVLEEMIKTLSEDDKAFLYHRLGRDGGIFASVAFRAGEKEALSNEII